jgi:hypothetical protein
MFNFICKLFSNSHESVITGKLTLKNKDKIIADLNGCSLVEKVLLSRTGCGDDMALYVIFKKSIKVVDETTNERGSKNTAVVLEDESFEFYPGSKLFKITA